MAPLLPRPGQQDKALNRIALNTTAADDSTQRLEQLAHTAQRMLERARAHGADQAEVSCNEDSGLEVNVRLGEVETVQSNRDRGLAITVYLGQRRGTASTADLQEASIEATVAQAVAIARYTEDDPAAGLADPSRMATAFPDLDTWHPAAPDADAAIELALACEQAGRDSDARITNSDGAGVSSNTSLSVYANSHGFVGAERSASHSISCALIAGQGDGMQRNGWYSAALSFADLWDAAEVGRKAAERTVSRLAPRSVATAQMPVLFATESARSLIAHLVSAVSGGALYRRSSFLLDSVGQSIFPDWFAIEERPLLPRGWRSTAFDAEGVATRDSMLIEGGVLQRYVLGSYSARMLGLESTGNAGGVHNLSVRANAGGLDELLAEMGNGLLVTELMGQGVNAVTGDYSRGAAGFWVENGKIAWPVDGITIAGNLRQMYANIVAVGNDVDVRSSVECGSILVHGMTVAGND